MKAKVNADVTLADASPIAKVWKANATMTLGKGDDTVELADYQAGIKAVADLAQKIDDLREEEATLLDQRDDAALALSGLNTRALSAIRGIFGPDSTEYAQAGGIRSSERKKPVRKTAEAK